MFAVPLMAKSRAEKSGAGRPVADQAPGWRTGMCTKRTPILPEQGQERRNALYGAPIGVNMNLWLRCSLAGVFRAELSAGQRLQPLPFTACTLEYGRDGLLDRDFGNPPKFVALIFWM